MRKTGKGMHVYIAHSPDDSEIAAALAEGLRYHGAEVLTTAEKSATGEYADPALDTEQKEEVADYVDPALEEQAWFYLETLRWPEPIQMEFRVFLSYAREDYSHAHRFGLELLRAGLDVYLDQSITGTYIGENWAERMFDELSTCCSMAFLLSPHSIDSTVVGYEVGPVMTSSGPRGAKGPLPINRFVPRPRRSLRLTKDSSQTGAWIICCHSE